MKSFDYNTINRLPYRKKYIFLKSERQNVCEELKELSALLSKFVESQRGNLQTLNINKDKLMKSKTVVASRITVTMETYKNTEKHLKILENEYQNLTEKLKKFDNPEYSLELKQIIVALNEKIRKLEKNRKKMTQSQLKKEKEIKIVAIAGETMATKELQIMKNSIVYFERKLVEAGKYLDEQKGKIQTQEKRLQELSSEYTSKHLVEAKKLGIAALMGNKVEEKSIYKKLIEKKDIFKKKLQLYQSRYKVTQKDYIQKIQVLEKQLLEVTTSVYRKAQYSIQKI